MATKKPYGMIDALKHFLLMWDELPEVIDYDLEWQQPLSVKQVEERAKLSVVPYSLQGMQKDPFFNNKPCGYIAKSMDDHGRKIIVVKTRLGLVVLWNVSNTPATRTMVLCECTPSLIAYGLDKRLEEKGVIYSLIGTPEVKNPKPGDVCFRNVGEWMELSVKMLNDPSYRPTHYETRIRQLNKEKQDGT